MLTVSLSGKKHAFLTSVMLSLLLGVGQGSLVLAFGVSQATQEGEVQMAGCCGGTLSGKAGVSGAWGGREPPMGNRNSSVGTGVTRLGRGLLINELLTKGRLALLVRWWLLSRRTWSGGLCPAKTPAKIRPRTAGFFLVLLGDSGV